MIPGRKSGGHKLAAHFPPEAWRLRYCQQAAWTYALRQHLYTRLGISPSSRVLDVGCGTGALLREFEEPYGLDIALVYLKQAQQYAPAARLASGDAAQMPFASACFDLVFCHFVLLWLPDPASALREMRRLARSGGVIAALAEPDYGGRIDYPAELSSLGERQEAALQRQGAETRLGRRLRQLFQQAGLADVECGVLGGQWSPADRTVLNDTEWQVLESDLAGQIDPQELTRLRNLDQVSRQDGERILFVPTFYAFGFTR